MQDIKDEVIESCDPTMIPFIKEETLDDTPFAGDLVVKVEDVENQNSSCSSVRQPIPKKVLFSCNTCDKHFFHKSELMAHTLHYHDEQHVCDVCGLGFAKDDHLQQHKKAHIDPTPEAQQNSLACYRSRKCSEKFIDKYKIKEHHSDFSPKTQLDLPRSGKPGESGMEIFKLNFIAKAHTIRPIQHFTCNVCKRAFIYSHHLNKHLALHAGTHPYSCKICNKRFAYKSGCGKSFQLKDSLTRHMLSHSSRKCKTCNKVFDRKDHLATHMRSHTGKKLYSCDVCLKSFTRNHSLKVHACYRPERNTVKSCNSEPSTD